MQLLGILQEGITNAKNMDIIKIEEQLKKVPEDIKKAFFSIETAKKIKDVGEDNGLLLDQIDMLIEEVGLTIIGLKPSDQFINTLMKNLGVNQKVAEKISDEINNKILSGIKRKSRISTEKDGNSKSLENKTNELKINDIATLERVGGFSVDKEKVEETNGKEVTLADKAKILEGIENPRPSHIYSEANVTNNNNNDHTEPLVDYLLTNPIAQKEKKVSVEVNGAIMDKKPTQTTPEKPKNDPYREAIK